MPFQAFIIDDDQSFKRIVEMRLKSFIPELSLTHFPNLASAREFFKSNKDAQIDLVILDQHLPDGQGIDFLNEGLLPDVAVLSMSSDNSPEIPGAALQAGAAYFLSKVNVSEPLFKPLVQGIIDRNRLQRELHKTKMNGVIVETVKTLVGTLRHEINNPLGAVLGAAYLLKTHQTASSEQKDAAELVESSGRRIKHVLDQLCQAISMEPVTKANQKVFHIPGDKPWGKE
ncbi:MAG: response regulator [Oligoflexia bacterium]|nr:response regulator [Oligoflexia bacterium]